MLLDHYRVLGVSPDVGPAALKKAFRRKVKEIHPDLNPTSSDISRRMKELLQAYETLVNPVLREEYDHAFLRYSGASPFDYRTFLKEENDPASLTKLIFYDLLHGYEDEAIARYVELSAVPEYSLSKYLDREDFMDCAYILAEEMELRGDSEIAFEFYYQIARLELEKPYFRFFFEEVILHLRGLFVPTSSLSLEKMILLLEKTIQLGLPARDTAWFMKTAAELYLKRNQRSRALFYLQESLRLDTRVSGIKDLRKKLRVV